MNFRMSFLEIIIYTLIRGIINIIRIPGTLLRLLDIGTHWVSQKWASQRTKDHFDDIFNG